MPEPAHHLEQRVYTGVTEEERPVLVAQLWHAGAIKVETVKTSDTYTVTATFRV
jgi:hypothetical protein